MATKKSYLDELYRKEQLEENKKMKMIQSHKCYLCVWGRWAGNKYTCMFLKCQK